MEARDKRQSRMQPPALHALPSLLTVSHTCSVRRASSKAQTFTLIAPLLVLPARSRQQVCLCDWEVERWLGVERERSCTQKRVHARTTESGGATEILKAHTRERYAALWCDRLYCVPSGNVLSDRRRIHARTQTQTHEDARQPDECCMFDYLFSHLMVMSVCVCV